MQFVTRGRRPRYTASLPLVPASAVGVPLGVRAPGVAPAGGHLGLTPYGLTASVSDDSAHSERVYDSPWWKRG